MKKYQKWLYERNRKELKSLRKVDVTLETVDTFSRTKKNMHLPIMDGIQEALKELEALRDDMEDTDCYLDSFEYLLRSSMVERIKEIRSKKRNAGVDEKFPVSFSTSMILGWKNCMQAYIHGTKCFLQFTKYCYMAEKL